MSPLFGQFINLLGAMLLMLAFAMISQRRVLSLVHLYTMQGVVLVLATAVVGYATHQPHLFVSAVLTLLLKVMLIPILLHRLIRALDVLIGVLILGVFMFQIREQFDSLDIRHLERLKED